MVLISFREWLHSYTDKNVVAIVREIAVLISFREWLHSYNEFEIDDYFSKYVEFSSLSESGFIPTSDRF